MNLAPRAKLYSPELLLLATSLAEFPLDDSFGLTGSARSQTCGGTLKVGLDLDREGRIKRIGLTAASCAVGQAAAAIFAAGVTGRTIADLKSMPSLISVWLKGKEPSPDWPGIDVLEPAREYPARHGAILLPWTAAIDALCNETASS